MLWAPSWGGMLNGLLTLRGAWHKLRTDPVLKFFAAGVTFYGMATFEGPAAGDQVGQRARRTTPTGHRPRARGALGWNGFMAAGMFYWLAPRALEHQALLRLAGQPALLARDGRHPALHRRDVGVRHHAGADAQRNWATWYDRLLVSAAPFTLLTFIAVAAGGMIQIIPTVIVNKAANIEDRLQVPYSPLELAGRDIYVREGCYNCHSQMIRTLVPDVLRYGDYSRLGESIYDHPYQWGSRRTGPDLARVGGKYPNIWHLRHMDDPRAISTGSNMPGYPWLLSQDLDFDSLPRKLAVQRMLGVPYLPQTPEEIRADVDAQSKVIADDLRAAGAYVAPQKEIVALIAYLQHLGRYETVVPQTASAR
jgi:cbb3-type cytochrome c oxidase subunit II